ncbi:hypothetical protein C7212DRAFT_276080 [Tuber magnatum]|uniref:Uncharacterized protein n=1 Tax=Tuber magnatum TaxID=42249 RepID=A0A317T296_9PEZI|nr:hypothetical protein C7212DRAFT_276080 [Tuber magnatum]
MILYKCRFGTLWITALVLCYHFLVVGGQTLGSLARNRCLQLCFTPNCPDLEANCVCSRFRTVLAVASIWRCASEVCSDADVMAGLGVLSDECRPYISTTTGRSRTSSSTTPVSPPTTTGRVITSTSTSAWRTIVPGLSLTSTSTSSWSRASSSRSSSSSSSTSSRCTTTTSVMNPSQAPPISTSVITTTPATWPTPSPLPGVPPPPPPPSGIKPTEPQRRTNRAVITAAVLGPLVFLAALLALFLFLRRRQGRNRRSIVSFTGIIDDIDANRGNISSPLPIFNPAPPRVLLADINIRPTTRGSQMSAGAGAGAMTAVEAARREPGRREYTAATTPVPGPSRSSSQLYIFPPASRRLPVAQRQPQSQQNSDLIRSLRKPLPQLPRLPEEARIRPRAGPATRGSPLTLPPTVYPIVDTPRPMSAISESAEADRYQPIPDDNTEAEFRKVYHDVRRALNQSPSTSTDQNSTDWSIVTDLSRNSTARSSRPER